MQAMTNASRPRLYPRISVLSYATKKKKKKQNCSFLHQKDKNGNILPEMPPEAVCTYLQSGVHQPPSAERSLNWEPCRPSTQETRHRRECAHGEEVLPPPPPHHPAPPLCGEHTRKDRRTGVIQTLLTPPFI